MSFLSPTLLLAALPVVALPILIHLINQRRYQTVRWGAMMFLLAANRMSRGYARIRQWLILAMRTAALAGLVFVLGRPLTGGWLGLTAGTRADATILLVDRSPSMQQLGAGSGASKLDAARRQLVRTLGMVGRSRWVVVDGSSPKPRELENLGALADAPDLGPSGAPADLPAMLQQARDYVEANRVGRADVWIASDLRANDWDPEGGRWQAVRDAFAPMAGRVRFHLLAYAQVAPTNLAVRVTGVKRVEGPDGAELLVSARVARDGAESGRAAVPVRFEIDGARSEVAVELVGRDAELKDHRVALGRGPGRGFGRVSIPADANPADDSYWFAFDKPAPRRTVVVGEDPEAARPLALAAAIAPDPAVACSAEVVEPGALTGVDWDGISLLLWQAPLPTGEAARLVKTFLDRGGRAVFFPPKGPAGAEFLGVRWGPWESSEKPTPVDGWRGDQDLLGATQGGAPLPVGQVEVRRHCRLEAKEVTALATLRGGAPLLARVATDRGGAYFCATGPGDDASTLARGGVVFYVLVQRALADGAASLEAVAQLDAGRPGKAAADPKDWRRLAGAEAGTSADYPAQPGVYEAGPRLLAVNRPAAEDGAAVVGRERVEGLFRGLDFRRVDDSTDDDASLVQEIWRLFLVAMIAALVAEAALCLPRRRPQNQPAGLMGAGA